MRAARTSSFGAYDAALAADPNSVNARGNRARLYCNRAECALTLEDNNEIVRLSSSDFRGYGQRTENARRYGANRTRFGGLAKKAEQLNLKAAVNLCRPRRDAVLSAATRRPARSLTRCIAIQPDSPECYVLRGDMFVAMGEAAKGQADYEMAALLRRQAAPDGNPAQSPAN